jgi:hypothetical protein
MRGHPNVRQVFILSLRIAAVAVPAAIFASMDFVPITFSIHWICPLGFVAGFT